MNYNLAVPFHRQFVSNPSRIAATIQGVEYSYKELGNLGRQIAQWLLNLQCGKVSRVGILTARSMEAIAGILGTCWAGAAYIPISPRFPVQRIVKILERSMLDVLIVDNSFLEILGEDILEKCPPRIIAPCGDVFIESRFPIQGKADLPVPVSALPPVDVSQDEMAYMLFTSGTTGEPKGVMVTAGNVFHFLKVSQNRYKINQDDRLSQHSELTFDHATFDLFMAWQAGASVHVVPANKIMAPADFIQKQKLTVWFGVPSSISFLQRMKLLKPCAFPSLRISLFAGEPLPVSSAAAWKAAAPNSIIHNLYGPTEVTVDCLWEPFSEPVNITPGRGTVAIGKPYPGIKAGIVDGSRNFLKQGEIGELAVSGPQVTAGYWKDPKLTTSKYPVLNHPDYGKFTWYLTGDLAYEDSSGRFHYLGRTDNQVKILGQRVELEDVESHMRDICKSGSVAALAWPVKEGCAQGIVGFVTGTDMETRQIKEIMKQRVPSYMVPRQIRRLKDMPVNFNGKIDRKALVMILEGDAPNN